MIIDRFSKYIQVPNFTKSQISRNQPVEAELFHVVVRTDRREETNSHVFSILRTRLQTTCFGKRRNSKFRWLWGKGRGIDLPICWDLTTCSLNFERPDKLTYPAAVLRNIEHPRNPRISYLILDCSIPYTFIHLHLSLARFSTFSLKIWDKLFVHWLSHNKQMH